MDIKTIMKAYVKVKYEKVCSKGEDTYGTETRNYEVDYGLV